MTSDGDEHNGPYDAGGFRQGPAVKRRLREGEHVYWPDGSVSVMTEHGLELLPWSWRDVAELFDR